MSIEKIFMLSFLTQNVGGVYFPFFLLVIIYLVILHQISTTSIPEPSICYYHEDTYTCSSINSSMHEKLEFPQDACLNRNCHSCIVVSKTIFLSSNFEILEPQDFILQAVNATSKTSSFYTCHSTTGHECDCTDQIHCTGSDTFCSFHECFDNATCKCNLTHQKSQFLLVTDELSITNPLRLTFPICLLEKNKMRQKTITSRRRLLEEEEAVFKEHNLTVRFQDPILYLPDIGRVILRNDDFEHIITVNEDKLIVLPFEMLAFKTSILIIYVHPKGFTVTGTINVMGKSICQLRQCYFCLTVFSHMKCLPKITQYAIYFMLTFLLLIFLSCLKFIFKSIIFFLRCISTFFYISFKFFKFTTHLSLILGAYFGASFRQTFLRTQHFLENHAVQGVDIHRYQLVIFALCLFLTSVDADCSNHAIVQSDLKTCEIISDGSKVCQVFTTAELSLPALSTETCLWFTDKRDNHLFSLNIKLDSVTCHFQTERLYYTFPVSVKHLSQISCIFNKFCGRGIHCQKGKVGKEGLGFEAETPESLQFPGLSSCHAGGLGVGCTILTRAACNFYRTWYTPNLLESYEVSKITGHKCRYHLSLHHSENNTISQLTLKDVAYTKTGIKVSILGAYEQPQLHMSDYFIQRVGRPSEAYLGPACPRNQPKAGQIGQVQANLSYSNDFIFDTSISQCDFFEDSLRCTSPTNIISTFRESQEYALPRERYLHLFHVQNGKLKSNLLVSSAVRIQLYFSRYKIAVQTTTVCPHLDDSKIEIMGCYNCPIFARLILKAHSTCQPGTVTVQFQEINVYTKAIHLQSESSSHVLKFLAEKKCYEEKLCLRAQTLIQCRTLQFCLEEPTVQLYQLNTNYTRTSSTITNSHWLDWFQMPKMGVPLVLLKLIGSSLFIICVTVTFVSTILTCCCRSR